MAYKIRTTKLFDKQARLCQRRGLPMHKLTTAMQCLATQGRLPKEYRQHKLQGNYKDVWECHLQPDWLLLWRQEDEEIVILFIATGTHADIFK